ncbi:hypothetical protein PI124_g15166 [Phytophthora idaei]|nr:hypothetical protein PI124_g15166 [Phytophthora idaei]
MVAKVMGPMVHTAAADDARVQPEADASRERAGSQYGEVEEVKKMLDCLTRLAERMECLGASQEPTEREAAPQWPRCQRVRLFTWTGEGDGSPGPGLDATTRQLVGGAAGHVLRHDAARVRERKRGDGTGAATGVTTALRCTSH